MSKKGKDISLIGYLVGLLPPTKKLVRLFLLIMKSHEIDKNLTKQVRIDGGLHTLLKIKAASAGVSIKTLLEGYVIDLLGEIKNEENI